MRRVAATGIGTLNVLEGSREAEWSSLTAGESGIRAIQSLGMSDLPVGIGAQVPRGDTASGLFNADDWVPPKDQRKMDTFIVFAMGAAIQAVEDSGWKPQDEEGLARTGVMIGAGIRGVEANDVTAPLPDE